MTPINIILAIILLALVGQSLWSWYSVKKAATVIENEAFKEKMRTAQVIDVREKGDFDTARITGARSFPMSTLKQNAQSLRKDQPILLYDNRRQQASRAAILLKKQGFTDIYILKNGYEGWDGRTKGAK